MKLLDKDALYYEIAREMDLDPAVVKEAADFQFRFLAEKIRSGLFDKDVRLPLFGVWKVQRKYLKYMAEQLMERKAVERELFRLRQRYPDGGRVTMTVAVQERLYNTILSLYDRIGDENADAEKTDLVGKSTKLGA